MRIAGSNRFFLNPNQNKTLADMARDEPSVDEMEEGEISDDPGAVERNLVEDRKQEGSPLKYKSDSKVWTEGAKENPWMRDCVKFQVSPNYGSDIYNLAWARAVQNKPLDRIVLKDYGSDNKSGTIKPRLMSTVSVNNREENGNSHASSVFLIKEEAKCNGKVDLCNEDDSSNGEINSKIEDPEVVDLEEGELEEGEIELGLDMVHASEKTISDRWCIDREELPSCDLEKQLKEKSLGNQLNLILDTLQTVTGKDDQKSFLSVCFQLRKSLESLQLMGSEALEPLVQLSFTGIQAAYSVYCSANLKQQEQNKDAFWRLLHHITNQGRDLFSREQMKEIEAMKESQVSDVGFSNIDALDREQEISKSQRDQIGNFTIPFTGTNVGSSHDSSLLTEKSANSISPSDRIYRPLAENDSVKLCPNPIPVGSGGGDNRNINLRVSRIEQPINSSVRGGFAPLIDLQGHQDPDSLPSPTRENLPPSILKLQGVGAGLVGSSPATGRHGEAEDITIYPSEKDVLKAVSSYQEKFGRTSFSSNRLPSPTPSEECEGDTDVGSEVSSSGVRRPTEFSYTIDDLRSLKPQRVGSLPHMGTSKGVVVPSATGPLASGLNSFAKTQPKSRDPRLRYGNTEVGAFDLVKQPPFVDPVIPKIETLREIMNPRKQKAIEAAVLDGHRLKKQRIGLADPRGMQMVSGRGGWLEGGGIGPQPSDRYHQKENMIKSENGDTIGPNRSISIDSSAAVQPNSNEIHAASEQVSQIGTSAAVSLPSLLKEIAVNPTVLMHLLKMEQQRLAAEAQQKSADPSQHTMCASSPSVLPETVSSGSEQKPVLRPLMPAQTAPLKSQNDLGKIRMKPRDPRRILHSNIVQKSDSSGSEQAKSSGITPLNIHGCKDHLTVREQGDQDGATCLPSQSSSLPDITSQFTKKLKNIADLVSGSQVIPPVVAINAEKEDGTVLKMGIKDQGSNPNSNLSTDKENKVGFSLLQDPWGDVDHLLEGYDDQQKVAIQRERARRIEEQNKMFAARKLSLVLDLDHTLLNSAKFLEVDQHHDEILRRKEEQDWEKPTRHLFRFAHMGMWTKLRPGIWNFLEKATKLYELHLYTMGNKLYATEMAKVLDPTGVLFNGRVISKGDDGDPFDGDERVPKSKDLDGVLGMESAVVIIDDSVRVWPHHRLNLIVVERYTYFPCSRRQFGLLGPSLLEIDHDERPEDGTLASSLAVIEKIHQNFFSNVALNSIDVRDILASEQRKILAGCRIIFSRVFPVVESNPHLHPIWQMAEQFGAVCTNQLDEQVTHVVAVSLGTDKVNWALSTGRFVVHPSWLEASALLYRRANELDFTIKP